MRGLRRCLVSTVRAMQEPPCMRRAAGDSHAFFVYMTIYGTAKFERFCLYIKDVEADANNYDVAAFCGDECRGVGKVVKGVLMMNVCGEGDETITFKAIDKKSGIVMDINESVTFTGDVLGAYTEPFRLTLGEENITDIAIIPSSTGIEEIVYNAAGQHVTKDKQALPKGVYIHMKNGKATKVFVK